MKRVVVISTGGTIASRQRGGALVPEAAGRDVLAAAVVPAGIEVEVIDLFTVDSARLTSVHQLRLLHAIHRVLADPRVDGVVITHGTDTMEESAFLLDLYHRDQRSVVLTGAQRSLDSPDSDAGRNLTDAIRTAATVRGRGALIVFHGTVYAARGTVKTQTIEFDAFADPSGQPLGPVGSLRLPMPPRPRVALPLPDRTRTAPRVDILMHHSDADATLFQAALAAGAEGIVLVGTGSGNATPQIAAAVADAVADGILVALTTRVATGPVTPVYAGGGGFDLVAAGAVPTWTLRAGQARIATVAALLSVPGRDAAARTAALHRIVDAPVEQEQLSYA